MSRVPKTFDEAVLEAIDKLYSWTTGDGMLGQLYDDLKWSYFEGDGSVFESRTPTQEQVVDYLLSRLFNTAKEAAELSLSGIADTVISKQHDYGHDNIAQFGEIGLVVRLADKVARIANLAGREAQNESLKDSYLDVCGYTVLFRMWRDGTFLLPLAEDPGHYGADHLWPENEDYAEEEYNGLLDFYGVDVGNSRGGW